MDRRSRSRSSAPTSKTGSARTFTSCTRSHTSSAASLRPPGFYTPVGVVQEFEAALKLELDFLQEARAIQRFNGLFKDHPDIMAPTVFDEFTTGRVLVLELLKGRPLSSIDPSDQETVEPMMDKLIDATYLQVFEYGFFHGDPHPGNLMLLDDGRLAYLDFGVTGTLTGRCRTP